MCKKGIAPTFVRLDVAYRELVRAFREARGRPVIDELDVVVTNIERLAGSIQTA